ncbi:MAG: lysylphosphatidylglycerol synthase transmembrane domain-containing protein [Chloroflexota bacterium]
MSEPRRAPAAWATAARFAASATLLWLVFRRVDAGAVFAQLGELRPGWVALALAVTVLQVSLLAWRWRFTTARLGVDLPFRTALGEYYLGILANQVLPGGVLGDLSRAWRHARSGAPTGSAVRAVILERASAQVVMTLTACVSAVWLLIEAYRLRMSGPGAVALYVVVALVAAAGVALALGARWFARHPSPDTATGRLRTDARHALLAREAFTAQLLSALAVVVSYVAVFVIAARAVGVTAPLVIMLPLVAPILMSMLVPVTVAGWGIREVAAAALWSFAGMTPEDGATVSVAYGLIVLVSSAPGALPLIAMLRGGRGRRARLPRE